MRERLDQFLKIGCFALGALLLFQSARAIVRNNPFSRVNIPEIPTLATGTNAPVSATNAVAAKSGTNAIRATNAASATNSVSPTNVATAPNATNVPPGIAVTNSAKAGTNSVAAQDSSKVANPVSRGSRPSGPPDMAMMGMPGAGKKLPDLPPATKARVDRISDSEILGQVIRPMPMALLGIAGNSAFLRSASGQTGVVKEGDSLGDLKLLRIGINRVLVEQDGQKKELTIFSGYGGESLLNKTKEPLDETTSK